MKLFISNKQEINSDKDDYKKNLAEESNRINYNDYRIDDYALELLNINNIKYEKITLED